MSYTYFWNNKSNFMDSSLTHRNEQLTRKTLFNYPVLDNYGNYTIQIKNQFNYKNGSFVGGNTFVVERKIKYY